MPSSSEVFLSIFLVLFLCSQSVALELSSSSPSVCLSCLNQRPSHFGRSDPSVLIQGPKLILYVAAKLALMGKARHIGAVLGLWGNTNVSIQMRDALHSFSPCTIGVVFGARHANMGACTIGIVFGARHTGTHHWRCFCRILFLLQLCLHQPKKYQRDTKLVILNQNQVKEV